MPEKPWRTAADIADWWDENRRETKGALEEFIVAHPNWFGIAVATAGNTAMDLAAGFVDVLRLGQGTAQGGWGYAHDGLRLLAIIPPLARVGGLVRNFRNLRLAMLIEDSGRGHCASITAMRALRQTGQKIAGKYLVTLDELARATGTTVENLEGVPSARLLAKLREFGARVGDTQTVSNMAEVEKLLSRDGRVVVMSLRGYKAGIEVADELGRANGHAVYAFRDFLGRVRVMDRTGIFRNLAEVAKAYGVDSCVPKNATVVYDLFGRYLDAAEKIGVLAFAASIVPTIGHDNASSAVRAFQQAHTGVPRNSRHHTVQPGDTLERLAKRCYGAATKWPIIYAGNRDVIGADPARLKLGQALWIPDDAKAARR